MFSFFAPNSEYVLKELDGGYIDLYASFLGGEIAKMALSDGRLSQDFFATVGAVYLIEFSFSFDLISVNNCGYPKDFALNQILAILFRGLKGQSLDRFVFLAQTDKEIPTNDIIDAYELI